MKRAVASHQCRPGSIPGPGVVGLSLLLILVFGPIGFSPGTPVFLSPQKPTFLNYNSTWTQWTESHTVDVPLLMGDVAAVVRSSTISPLNNRTNKSC